MPTYYTSNKTTYNAIQQHYTKGTVKPLQFTRYLTKFAHQDKHSTYEISIQQSLFHYGTYKPSRTII